MHRSPVLSATVIVTACCLGFAQSADAKPRIKEGQWRIELSGGGGLDAGSRDRSGDVQITGTLDWEFPATKRTTLALRLLPLFVYTQDNEDRGFFEEMFSDEPEDDDTVYGGGLGFAYRIYQKKEEYRGVFFELHGFALGHINRFEGNGSNFNFLTGIGAGYQFRKDWHLILKAQHISNASLDSDNDGANSVSLGVGYRF